jgi:hypothetical protein
MAGFGSSPAGSTIRTGIINVIKIPKMKFLSKYTSAFGHNWIVEFVCAESTTIEVVNWCRENFNNINIKYTYRTGVIDDLLWVHDWKEVPKPIEIDYMHIRIQFVSEDQLMGFKLRWS